jgi:hypothetical protein
MIPRVLIRHPTSFSSTRFHAHYLHSVPSHQHTAATSPVPPPSVSETQPAPPHTPESPLPLPSLLFVFFHFALLPPAHPSSLDTFPPSDARTDTDISHQLYCCSWYRNSPRQAVGAKRQRSVSSANSRISRCLCGDM